MHVGVLEMSYSTGSTKGYSSSLIKSYGKSTKILSHQWSQSTLLDSTEEH